MRRVLVSSAYRKNFKIFEEFFMSFIYNKKRMGSRILPCGKPHTICIISDKLSPIFTIWCLFFSYESNQSFAGPLTHSFLVCLIRYDG